jgi:hypothetical protein
MAKKLQKEKLGKSMLQRKLEKKRRKKKSILPSSFFFCSQAALCGVVTTSRLT